MKTTIITLACLMLTGPAWAGSSWYEISNSGTAETNASASAAPNRTYITTIDATGESEPIITAGCKTVKIIGATVGSTYTPQICESKLCTYAENCHTSGAIAAGAGCHEDGAAVAAFVVTSATENDVVYLTCGGK